MSSEPNSPILGITPKWLIQKSKGVGNVRYMLKMLALGLFCILLGISTSRLSSVEESVPSDSSYGGYQYETLGVSHGKYSEAHGLQPGYLHRGTSQIESQHRPGHKPATASSNDSMVGKLAAKISSLNPLRKSKSSNAEEGKDDLLSTLYAHDSLKQTKEVILDPWNASSDSPPPTLAKITIVTGGRNGIYERALRTHAAHNRIHGYPMHTLRQSILNDVWSKPAYILSVLLLELAKPAHARLQWLFWVDADTIIINPHVPAETFLPPTGWADDVHLLVAHDFNGLNNGVFPIRVHPWSVDLLAAVLSYPYYKPDDFLLFRDQSAMARILETPKFARHTVRAPQRWFNAYQGEINETIAPFQTRPGDLLVHFAGVPDRDARMLYWLERAEEHLPEWEIEFKYTSYRSETREFWETEKARRQVVKKAVKKLKEEMDARREMLKEGMRRWGDALSDGERKRIDGALVAVYRTFEDDDTALDIGAMKKAINQFKEAMKPLQNHMDKSNKLLLKEAHTVLFTAENLTVSFTPTAETQEPFKNLEKAIKHLKEILLAPVVQAELIESKMRTVQQRQGDVEKLLEAQERQRHEEEEKRQKEEEEARRMQEEEQERRLRESEMEKSTEDPSMAELEIANNERTRLENQALRLASADGFNDDDTSAGGGGGGGGGEAAGEKLVNVDKKVTAGAVKPEEAGPN